MERLSPTKKKSTDSCPAEEFSFDTPLFHIDVHGKKDRSWNTDIDLGVKAIRENFDPADKDSVVKPLIETFARKLNKLFEGVVLNGFPVVCNPAGEL